MNNVERDYENIFLVLLAVLKAKGCDYVHIPQLKKVVLENVYAPVLKNHLVGFPEDLTVFISDLEISSLIKALANASNTPAQKYITENGIDMEEVINWQWDL